jgi:hypothetical protein
VFGHVRELQRRIKAHNVVVAAAGVAFYGLLALVPTLIALVSIYGLVADPADIEQQVSDLAGSLDEGTQDLLVDQLRDIVGADSLAVNSAHHQAAKDEPAGIVVNAIAPDGVIEGIEAPGKTFCIGVQWHPEFALSEGDVRLFAAFVAAARSRP